MISIQWIVGALKGADELDVSVWVHPLGRSGIHGVWWCVFGREPSQVQIIDVQLWFISTRSIDYTSVTGFMVDCNRQA